MTLPIKKRELFSKLQLGVGLPSQDFADYEYNISHNGKLVDKSITDQQDLAKKNMTEYQALKAKDDAKKEPLSDAEKARLASLEKDVSEVSETLNGVEQDLAKQIDDKYGHYLQVMTDLLHKTVATVAKTKNLSLVVSKAVQTRDNMEIEVVLCGGTDITDEVIKSMNASFKPSMLDEPAPAAAAPAATPAAHTAPAKK